MVTTYEYQKPQNTYTIDQFINCQSSTAMCHYNMSFLDRSPTSSLIYSTYNVISDYIDELTSEEYARLVVLNPTQMLRYRYRPKLLAFDVYGNTELFFIIMTMNDMYSFKQFIKNRLLLPTQDGMDTIITRLNSANKDAIKKYNNSSLG